MWILVAMIVAIIGLLAFLSARSSPPPVSRDEMVQDGRHAQSQDAVRGRHDGAKNLPSSSQDSAGRFDSLGGGF